MSTKEVYHKKKGGLDEELVKKIELANAAMEDLMAYAKSFDSKKTYPREIPMGHRNLIRSMCLTMIKKLGKDDAKDYITAINYVLRLAEVEPFDYDFLVILSNHLPYLN